MVRPPVRVRAIALVTIGLAVAVVLLTAGVAAQAAGCDNTYVGAVDGSWTTPANWSQGTPTSVQVVCIPAGFGTIHVPTFTDVDASSLAAGSAIDIAPSSQILLHDTDPADMSTLAGLTIADQAVLNSGSPVSISGNARIDGSILVQSGIGPLTLAGGGTLSGIGTINAVFDNVAGTVAPGDPGAPGRLTFGSSFTQETGGTLALDLASDVSFDDLRAVGAVSLAGTVTVNPLGGYVPAVGTSWDFVLSNPGATLTSPVTASPGTYSVHLIANGFRLTLDSLPPPPSPPPPPAITAPAEGATFALNAVVDASYSCAPGANGGVLKAGPAGCSGPVPNGSAIDTASLGAHTFTVTATDTDDQTAATTSHYMVTDTPIVLPPPPSLQPPPRNLTAPAIVDVPGDPHAYTCSPGTWSGAEGTVDLSGQVTTFTYTWQRLVPDASYFGGYKIDTVATGPSYRPTAGSAIAIALQSWLIRCVVATSNAGGPASATSAPRTLSPAIGPTVVPETVNVRVSGIEVTQGVQSGSCLCMGTLPSRDQSNLLTPAQVNYQGVTMAAGKFTVVRVFASFTQPAGLASLPGATAQLEIFDSNGTKFATLSPDSSPAAIGQSLCSVCVTIGERNTPGASFNFLVPWTDTLHRALSFRATVRPPTGLGALQQCAGCDANTFTLVGVPFVPTVTVPIHPIQLTVGGVGTAKTPNQVFGDTQTVLPVNVQIFPYDAPIPVDGVGPSLPASNPNAQAALIAANNTVTAAVDQRAIDNNVDDTQYPIGVFDQGASALANGVTMSTKILDGGIGPPISLVQTNRTLTSVMHEIGHGLGLVHADTGSPSTSCPPPRTTDNCGPHPDGTADCTGNSKGQVGETWPPDNEGRLENQAVGLDRRKWDVLKTGSLPVTLVDGLPTATTRLYDFMSYCPAGGVSEAADWISIRNWTRLVNFKPPSSPALPARSVRAAGATMLVLAVINPDGTTSITDVGPGQHAPSGPSSGSPFRVELHDASGAMLSSVAPTANVIHSEGEPPGVLLEATVPMTANAASVSVSSDGNELARRVRSAHAPTVALFAPRSPLSGTAKTLVRWSAKDADGDRLTATVQYSADGGRHWKVVAGPVSAGSAKVAPRLLSASTNARLRVRVNDGFNMAEATSGRLVATGTPPLVQIADVGRSGHVRSDATVLLQGSAFDDADRPLTGAHLKWYAGTALLGSGAQLTVHGLKPGTTVIRLVATDTHRRSSQAQLRVSVSAALPQLVVSRAPAQVSASAHSVRIVVATAGPATLTIAGAHYALTRKPRTITVPIHPGSSILRLTYSLRSPGGVTHGVYFAAR